MSDYTFNIPKLEVPLPSGGKTYRLKQDGTPLDKVMVRAMTAKDENILHSPTYLQSGFAFTKLVQACITTPMTVDTAEMLTGDVNTLLFMIRMLSYGNIYPVDKVICPDCNGEFKHEFDLSQGIETKELIVDPVMQGENRFAFVLPNSNINIEFKLETRNILNNIEIINKKMKKNNVEESLTTRLKNLIISIDGKNDSKTISDFVENHLIARDSLALRNYINEISPRLETKSTIKCPLCGEVSEVEIPMDFSFLYPDK